MNRIEYVSNKAKEQMKNYLKHSYIWTESRSEYMHYFLNYGRLLSREELAALEEDEDAVKKEEPSLEEFKEQIDKYEILHEELKGMEHTKTWQVCSVGKFRTTKTKNVF